MKTNKETKIFKNDRTGLAIEFCVNSLSDLTYFKTDSWLADKNDGEKIISKLQQFAVCNEDKLQLEAWASFDVSIDLDRDGLVADIWFMGDDRNEQFSRVDTTVF